MKYKSKASKNAPIFKKKKKSPAAIIVVIVIVAVFVVAALYYFAWRPLAPKTAPAPIAYPEGELEKPARIEEMIPIEPIDGEWDKIKTSLIENGYEISEYHRQPEILFEGVPSEWEGVSAFRSNEYRNGGAYGAAYIEKEMLQVIWERKVGTFEKQSYVLGQPLIVAWKEELWDKMNILPEKQEKENVIEVIYPTMNGTICFLDFEDGKPTREPIVVDSTIAGSALLDPRGYPILYVGSSGANDQAGASMHLFNLLDGSEMCRLSGQSDFEGAASFACAPIVSGSADTLIWLGEDTSLYTIKLNTKYDGSVDTIDI